MLRPQPNGFNAEETLPSTRARELAPPASGPSIKAKGNTIWGMSKAAEGCKHHETEGQLGGSALVPGASFVQRKTPAAAGVVKGPENSKEQSQVSRREDGKLSRVCEWAPFGPQPTRFVVPKRSQGSPRGNSDDLYSQDRPRNWGLLSVLGT